MRLLQAGGRRRVQGLDRHRRPRRRPARVAALRVRPGRRGRRPDGADRQHLAGRRAACAGPPAPRTTACDRGIVPEPDSRPGPDPVQTGYDDDGHGPDRHRHRDRRVERARRHGVPPARGQRRGRPRARRRRRRGRGLTRRPPAGIRAQARRDAPQVRGHAAARASARRAPRRRRRDPCAVHRRLRLDQPPLRGVRTSTSA